MKSLGRAFRPRQMAALAVVLFQLACQTQPPAPAMPKSDVAAVQSATLRSATTRAEVADRYDLQEDERRGGHTLARHVGRSDADLRERLRRERQIGAASTYTDRITAERVVAMTLARHRAKVDQWLARQGPRPNLVLDYRSAGGEWIGRSLARRDRQVVPCSDALIVLRWDGRGGFYVLTSYPELER